jgi:hypothetical protein
LLWTFTLTNIETLLTWSSYVYFCVNIYYFLSLFCFSYNFFFFFNDWLQPLERMSQLQVTQLRKHFFFLTSLFNMIRTSVAPIINPCVNRTLIIKLNFEKKILNFKLISNDKKYSKFSISPTLSLKMMKSPQEILHMKSFPVLSNVHPNFPIVFSFIFSEFSLTKLINIQ